MEDPVTFTPKTPEPNSDGGQAFPAADAGFGPPWGGMTLRDWFAGQALVGYFAAPHTPHQNAASAEVAGYMYDMADAMLAARGGSNA